MLPDASVAVQVTVVVPSGKQLPDGGLHTTVAPGQLSPIIGSANVTTVQVSPGWGVTAVMFAGQVIVGGSTSITDTVNEQLAVLPP